MTLTDKQKELIAKYLSDVSKLVFTATVLNFFVQVTGTEVSEQTLLFGSLITLLLFIFSVTIRK